MYIVVEIQLSSEGSVSIPPVSSYENRNAAESKYHTVLATAAISSLPKHGAIMFDENCQPLLWHVYEHEEA